MPSEIELLPDDTAPDRRRRAHALTIPEQIANRVAAAIVNGEYRDGERLREQELAEAFGVSRGPVREALRALERYSLAILLPRRGAYVVGISLGVIAEAFNVRAALAGIAARQLTRRGDASATAVAELEAALSHADSLVELPAQDSIRFQHAIRETARCVYRHCGAGHIERALNDQVDRSIWGLMWRAQPLDFHSRERRLESIAYWRQVLAAVRAGNEHAAEQHIRAEILATRDSVIAALGVVRGESVDPALMFRD
ncbi:MAG: GntR family transcriptional regulator [Acetobacteraceae bacterium]|nr:GntR family transcriptional regulator [Acetobacteraceae bacterium]